MNHKIFLGLSPQENIYDKARAVIVPVPYEMTTSYIKGTAKGPEAILTASYNVEFYDIELDYEPCKVGLYTTSQLRLEKKHEPSLQLIQQETDKILADGKFPILLGGEHTLSYAPFLAAFKRFKNLSVLHFDAHTDLRSSYEGTPYSHACVIHQIQKHTNQIVSIGVRSMCQEERDLVRKRKIHVFYDHEIQSGLPVQKILDLLTENVYLTIDLDAFNPAFFPAVGTPEPGGIDWYPTLKLLRTVFENRNVVGADIVELCPHKGDISSDFIAAKLAYKIIGYKFAQFFS